MTFDILDCESQEAVEAARWYESKLPGLGNEFIEELHETFDRIADHPLSFPRINPPRSQRHFRFAVLRRFAYVIYFEVFESRVLVHAVAQDAKRPYYWLRKHQQGDRG